MRRTVIAALAVVAPLGCSDQKSHPISDRLNSGQIVIVAPLNEKVIVATIKPPDETPFAPGSPPAEIPRLHTGDKAEVITDEVSDDSHNRPVKIRVLSYSGDLPASSFVGLICTITRHDIRAVSH